MPGLRERRGRGWPRRLLAAPEADGDARRSSGRGASSNARVRPLPPGAAQRSACRPPIGPFLNQLPPRRPPGHSPWPGAPSSGCCRRILPRLASCYASFPASAEPICATHLPYPFLRHLPCPLAKNPRPSSAPQASAGASGLGRTGGFKRFVSTIRGTRRFCGTLGIACPRAAAADAGNADLLSGRSGRPDEAIE